MAETLTFRQPVYTFQIDFNRHVSNVVYVEWMEMGRLKLLEAIGLPVQETEKAGFLPVLVETQIRYRRPLYMGDTVEVTLWLSELAGVHACVEFRFRNEDGELVAEARQKGVFVSVETNRPTCLTDEQRVLFSPYLASKHEGRDARPAAHS